MKKNLLGLIAVVLAIGFSAFSVKKNAGNRDDVSPFYWYYYNPSTDQLTSQIGTGQLTHSAAVTQSGCPDISGPDCARGYTSSRSVPEDGPPAGDDFLLDD